MERRLHAIAKRSFASTVGVWSLGSARPLHALKGGVEAVSWPQQHAAGEVQSDYIACACSLHQA